MAEQGVHPRKRGWSGGRCGREAERLEGPLRVRTWRQPVRAEEGVGLEERFRPLARWCWPGWLCKAERLLQPGVDGGRAGGTTFRGEGVPCVAGRHPVEARGRLCRSGRGEHSGRLGTKFTEASDA